VSILTTLRDIVAALVNAGLQDIIAVCQKAFPTVAHIGKRVRTQSSANDFPLHCSDAIFWHHAAKRWQHSMIIRLQPIC